MLSRSLECQAATTGRQIFGIRRVYRETFLQIHERLLRHLTRKSQILGSLLYVRTHITACNEVNAKTPDTTFDPRCRSGPSARNSVVPSEGRFSKNYGADQQRLEISELHLDKFSTPATFACWKIRFKTEVCTCSQFPTEAMLWIKEVEMVESVDDLKSSRSMKGTHGPDFEVLDAKIASALSRIIHDTRFKRRIVSLEEQKVPERGPFPSWKTDRLPDLRFLPGHWSQRFLSKNYADLFTISLRNDDIQEFDSKWNGILLSMTKIPSDDILEGLYKLGIRESEKFKTVLEL